MEVSRRKKTGHLPQHNKAKMTRATASRGFKLNSVLNFLKTNDIFTTIIFVVVVLKYFGDSHISKSNLIKVGDIYEILGVRKDADISEIKSRYRELSLKWHPDKNRDCPECEEKFLKIKEAYKILLNPYLKEIYDKTDGLTVDVIPSDTVDITPDNYDSLVKGSGDVWLIQVYSDDSPASRVFATLWNDYAKKLGKYAKFGRINTLIHKKLVTRQFSNVIIYPAVFMIEPSGKYHLFPTTYLDDSDDFTSYFYEVYPSLVKEYSKANFKKPTFVFCNTEEVPLLVKYSSIRFKHHFDIVHSPSVHNVLKVDELSSYGLNLDRPLVIYYNKSNIINARSIELKVNTVVTFINSILKSFDPPPALYRETFDSLCRGHVRQRKLCVVELGVPNRDAESTILKKVTDAEATTLDIQVVRLGVNNVGNGMKKLVGELEDALMLLDADKNKFCIMLNNNPYNCDWIDNSDLTWVDNLIRGEKDSLSWHNLPDGCKDNLFKRNCLRSHKSIFF